MPNNTQLFSKYNERYVWYDNQELPVTGDYRICMQNMQGIEKKIYFSVISFTRRNLSEVDNLDDAHDKLQVFILNQQYI